MRDTQKTQPRSAEAPRWCRLGYCSLASWSIMWSQVPPPPFPTVAPTRVPTVHLSACVAGGPAHGCGELVHGDRVLSVDGQAAPRPPSY